MNLEMLKANEREAYITGRKSDADLLGDLIDLHGELWQAESVIEENEYLIAELQAEVTRQDETIKYLQARIDLLESL